MSDWMHSNKARWLGYVLLAGMVSGASGYYLGIESASRNLIVNPEVRNILQSANLLHAKERLKILAGIETGNIGNVRKLLKTLLLSDISSIEEYSNDGWLDPSSDEVCEFVSLIRKSPDIIITDDDALNADLKNRLDKLGDKCKRKNIN